MLTVLASLVFAAQEDKTLTGHAKEITSLAFRPDGRVLASLSADNTIRYWDLNTGKEIRKVASEATATQIAFDSKGARLAVEEAGLRILDGETGEEKSKLEIGFGGIMGLAFMPDGALLVAATAADGVQFVDASTGETVRAIENAGSIAALRSDGKAVAYTTNSTMAHVADAVSLKEIRSFSGHAGTIEYVALSADGQRLFTADDQGSLRGWDVSNGKQLFEFKKERAFGMALRSDGKILALELSGEVVLVDASTGKEIRKIEADASVSCGTLDFSPDGKVLAIGLSNGGIRLIHLGK